jgi:hypothetical protein
MYSETLPPGSWPPSPGLAPWAILIWIWSALTRYSAVTPKRPDATCLIGAQAVAVLQRQSTSTTSLPITEASVSPFLMGMP